MAHISRTEYGLFVRPRTGGAIETPGFPLLFKLSANPPFQFLHEDDLARILAIIIQRGIAGVFNVAVEGVGFYREVAEFIPYRLIYLPIFP